MEVKTTLEMSNLYLSNQLYFHLFSQLFLISGTRFSPQPYLGVGYH